MMHSLPAPIPASHKKLLRKLVHKKYRQQENMCLVAGMKSMAALVGTPYKVVAIYITPAAWQGLPLDLLAKVPRYLVTAQELDQLSPLTHHEDLLALVRIPPRSALPAALPARYLILDDIQNPRNLGALLRVAHWYGMEHLVASLHTVDQYNPKVIQSSMGSFAHVQVHYRELVPYCAAVKHALVGATLTGTPLNKMALPPVGALVMGNEGRGIAEALYPYLTHQATIVSHGGGDSLNVAVAAGIICESWCHTSL